jgi:threonine dehydratase
MARIKISVNDMQTVTDKEALSALKFLLEEEKILVEPATSCIVASLLENKFEISSYDSIGIILCGANISLRELQDWKIV